MEGRAELANQVASGMLRGPLTALIVCLCEFQLATWIPHLLTWPFFVDHDVFSTLAFGCGFRTAPLPRPPRE